MVTITIIDDDGKRYAEYRIADSCEHAHMMLHSTVCRDYRNCERCGKWCDFVNSDNLCADCK